MEYEFVLVLKNNEGKSDADYKQQEIILSNILQAGIHATVLANTRNTANKIILLLNAPLWLLAREDKLMKMERIVEYHSEEDVRSNVNPHCMKYMAYLNQCRRERLEMNTVLMQKQ